MKPLVIFGNRGLADMIAFYCRNLGVEIAAFTVDAEYMSENHYLGCPVVPFEELSSQYKPAEVQFFVAIGASDLLGKIRKEKMDRAEQQGYTFFSYCYAPESVQKTMKIGRNVFLMPECVVDPLVTIGDGVIAWNGATICHHTHVGNYSFVAPGATICGRVQIEEHCFIGANATIRDNRRIAPYTLVGAGAVITKDTESHGVYMPGRTVKINMASEEIHF